jgi:hypothetical protein
LIKFAEDILKRLRPVIGVPGVSGSVTKLSGLLAPMFGPTAVKSEADSPAVS